MTGEAVADARVRPGTQLEGPYVELVLSDARCARLRAHHGRERRTTARHRARRQGLLGAGDPRAHPRRRAQITGNFDIKEAHDLAIVLRAGALPAPINIIEERTVGPSLGRDSIRQGIISLIVGGGARDPLHGLLLPRRRARRRCRA